MPVFISHRTADDAVARGVYSRLTQVHGIECYLDDLDREAYRTGRITELIVTRLTACSNLLALITENTKGSWWVPFEIGVARQAPRIITSYTNLQQGALPEYLREWPVLRGESAIDAFATHYKRQALTVRRTLVEKRGLESDGIAAVSQFHRELKAELQQ